MEAIKQYVISITAAAILCILAPSIFSSNNTYTGAVKFLCSLIFMIILVSPWKNFRLEEYDWFWESAFADAKAAVDEGVFAFNDLQAAGIKEKTAAYILDKAKEYDLELDIQVELDDSSPPMPENIIISGISTPLQKQQLRQIVSRDLDIPKERILWQ